MQMHGIHALCLTAFSPLLVLSSFSSSVSTSFCQFVHPSDRAHCVQGLALRARESQMNKTLSRNLTLESHSSGAA